MYSKMDYTVFWGSAHADLRYPNKKRPCDIK
jgi:hypothetical protein